MINLVLFQSEDDVLRHPWVTVTRLQPSITNEKALQILNAVRMHGVPWATPAQHLTEVFDARVDPKRLNTAISGKLL